MTKSDRMSWSERVRLLVALLCLIGSGFVWQYWPMANIKNAGDSSAGIQRSALVPSSELDLGKTERRQEFKYTSLGVNLFSYGEQQGGTQRKSKGTSGSPASHTVQQLDLAGRFFGYGSVPIGAPRRALLVLGEEIYIVREGDMLMGRFKILKISNASLEFEEVSSGRHGQKMLEDQGQSPNA